MVQLRKVPFYYYISLASYSLILFLSLMPIPENVPNTINISDKLIHVLMYGFLSTASAISLLTHNAQAYNPIRIINPINLRKISGIHNLKTVWIFPSLWGITMECFQGLTTYRSFSFLDMLANLIGSTLASLLIFGVVKYYSKKISPRSKE